VADDLSFIDEELKKRGVDPQQALLSFVQPGSMSRPQLPAAKALQRAPETPAAPEMAQAQTAPSGGMLSFANQPQPAAPAVKVSAAPALSFTKNFQDVEARRKNEQGPEPTREQFPAEKLPVWKKILGALASTAAGVGNPDAAGETARRFFGGPERRAEKKFETARQTWEEKGKTLDQEEAKIKEAANLQKEDDQSRFATPEKRQAYADQNPNVFEGVSDFEKNDFILTGKFPQREPSGPKDPTNAFELWRQQNPKAPVSEWLKLEQSAKPAPADANKLAGEIEAQVGPKPVADANNPNGPVQWNGKTYPNERAAQVAWGQAAERIKNNEAAAGADARGKAYGANRPMNVLDTWNGNRPVVVSAKDAEENPQRYVTQAGGAKALAGQVTVEDIEGALNNLKETTKVLDGGSVNRAAIASVLADPKTTTSNFLQSEVAGTLNADEQDYVIAVLTAREVVPGIRNLLGTGAATDSRVKNMLDTLPGPKTPNSEFANKQIDSALATLKRVKPAVPNVKAQGAGANKPATGDLPPGWK